MTRLPGCAAMITRKGDPPSNRSCRPTDRSSRGSLPTTCALTNAEENGIEAELARLDAALAGGLRFVQIRDKRAAGGRPGTFAGEVVARGPHTAPSSSSMTMPRLRHASAPMACTCQRRHWPNWRQT